jgi:type II secretion system protein G
MATISNSDRHLLKATYAPIEFEQPPDKLSQAQPKAALVRGLQLQSGEVDAVRSKVAATGVPPIPDPIWSVLKQFEPQPIAALMPKASVLADVHVEHLQTFAKATLNHRIEQLRNLDQPQSPPPSDSSAGSAALSPDRPVPAPPRAAALPLIATRPVEAAPAAVRPVNASPVSTQMIVAAPPAALVTPRAIATSLVTSAQGALDTFTNAVKITPIGMLHLERVEMSPAGVERGELVATIPLAPDETTSVTQKEWSVTSQDFSSIVTDYLENYSEKGVTEKSELAESTESQTKHSQQLGFSASLSGSYGFVTFATNASANISDSVDTSSKQSRKAAKEVTSKASSRSRKEHKVTIQVSSTTGTEETSTRTLTNPSTTDTLRIDYFSMMRKWRVRLIQYGLRLTYDLAIPEPGATLRKLHAELASINQQLEGSFNFALDPSAITDQSYQNLNVAWGVAIEPPPDPTWSPPPFSQTLQSSKDASVAQTLEFDVKEGYAISALTVGGYGSPSDNGKGYSIYIAVPPSGVHLSVPENQLVDPSNPGSATLTPKDVWFFTDDSNQRDVPVNAFDGQMGHVSIPFMQDYMSSGILYASVQGTRTNEAFVAWQQRVWQTIHDAARDAYYTQVQALNQRRDALKAQLEGVDTLTLRREELEEVMKGVLRWLLGPDFDFMPQDVASLFTIYTCPMHPEIQQPSPGKCPKCGRQLELLIGQSFTGNELGLNPDGWNTMFIYGEMVKFIQQAIEWENLLYMVYPYFWDVPTAWDFARTLEHPDSTREAFLRAGSARVVLTIRPGYEEAFISFVELGELGKELASVLPPDHPYLTIGQEIHAYDQTNYPGIPPANPDQQPRPLLTPLQRKAWQDMQDIAKLLESYKTKNNGYPTTAEGLAALSTFAATLSPPQTVPAADPWGNPYQYQSPGKLNDYDLASFGADGVAGGEEENDDITSWADSSLIAEWFEYTPTHGLDISVASNPTDLA